MNDLFLSDDAYAALKSFSLGVVPGISNDILSYLVERGLVCRDVIDYDTSGIIVTEIFSEFHITEFGRGYLAAYERHLEETNSLVSSADSSRRNAEAAERYAEQSTRTAEASETLSQIAKEKASRADIKSIISLVLAFTALLFEFAVNHTAIIQFFKLLLKKLST